MENFTINDILKATKGKLVKGSPDSEVSNISTDSRKLSEGDLFVALIGEKFDGHDFMNQAVDRGAMGLMVSKDIGETSVKNLISVKDTLKALGDIAGFYRSRFDIPVIGVTGSNGKTTTKDMIASVLSSKYSVLKNEGNLNNAIGVPMTLFKLSRSHEMAVIEMGISIPGEMARLVEIVRPDVAVVTNIGPTHLEFLGSMDNVAFEKGILAKSAGMALLNADDPRVAKMRNSGHDKVIMFGLMDNSVSGLDLSNAVMATEICQDHDGRPEFTMVAPYGKIRIILPSLGKHNIYNALAAASVGVLFNVELDRIKEALETHTGTPMRMQKIVIDGVTIIDDTYNSNLTSLKAAVNFISQAECTGKRIAVIGDMLELGEQSAQFHKEAGQFMAGQPIQTLITVGEMSKILADAALGAGFDKDNLIVVENNVEAVSRLREIMKEGDLVLIKGSRGMKMDEIVRSLTGNQKSSSH